MNDEGADDGAYSTKLHQLNWSHREEKLLMPQMRSMMFKLRSLVVLILGPPTLNSLDPKPIVKMTRRSLSFKPTTLHPEFRTRSGNVRICL